MVTTSQRATWWSDHQVWTGSTEVQHSFGSDSGSPVSPSSLCLSSSGSGRGQISSVQDEEVCEVHQHVRSGWVMQFHVCRSKITNESHHITSSCFSLPVCWETNKQTLLDLLLQICYRSQFLCLRVCVCVSLFYLSHNDNRNKPNDTLYNIFLNTLSRMFCSEIF